MVVRYGVHYDNRMNWIWSSATTHGTEGIFDSIQEVRWVLVDFELE